MTFPVTVTSWSKPDRRRQDQPHPQAGRTPQCRHPAGKRQRQSLPARFYQEPKRYALPTQLHFLFERSRQLRELAQGDLFRAGTVSDFLIDKDMLFARLNLDDDEFDLYQKVYADLALQAPTPDLVIYLQAPVDALQERVKRRGVEFERGMDAGYLQRLANSYSEFFHRYEAAPLLIVNTSNLNFAESEADFELLVERMSKMRGPREFFNRAA